MQMPRVNAVVSWKDLPIKTQAEVPEAAQQLSPIQQTQKQNRKKKTEKTLFMQDK